MSRCPAATQVLSSGNLIRNPGLSGAQTLAGSFRLSGVRGRLRASAAGGVCLTQQPENVARRECSSTLSRSVTPHCPPRRCFAGAVGRNPMLSEAAPPHLPLGTSPASALLAACCTVPFISCIH